MLWQRRCGAAASLMRRGSGFWPVLTCPRAWPVLDGEDPDGEDPQCTSPALAVSSSSSTTVLLSTSTMAAGRVWQAVSSHCWPKAVELPADLARAVQSSSSSSSIPVSKVLGGAVSQVLRLMPATPEPELVMLNLLDPGKSINKHRLSVQ